MRYFEPEDTLKLCWWMPCAPGSECCKDLFEGGWDALDIREQFCVLLLTTPLCWGLPAWIGVLGPCPTTWLMFLWIGMTALATGLGPSFALIYVASMLDGTDLIGVSLRSPIQCP